MIISFLKKNIRFPIIFHIRNESEDLNKYPYYLVKNDKTNFIGFIKLKLKDDKGNDVPVYYFIYQDDKSIKYYDIRGCEVYLTHNLTPNRKYLQIEINVVKYLSNNTEYNIPQLYFYKINELVNDGYFYLVSKENNLERTFNKLIKCNLETDENSNNYFKCNLDTYNNLKNKYLKYKQKYLTLKSSQKK
jgi:hypothetical protein